MKSEHVTPQTDDLPLAHRVETHPWTGEYWFLLLNLIKKDFKIRYRNMSLGVVWSLANPLVMMGVLTFIFTKIFRNTSIPDFPLFVLAGLVPFNFFTLSWFVGTMSVVENATLVKRVRFPREIVPISAVLGNFVHFIIQGALLVTFVYAFGRRPNVYWLWLPVVAAFEVVFLCGLALIFSALDVFIRDIRYVVESANTMLFWLVPIFYSFAIIPMEYKEIYSLNPVAAVVLAFQRVLLDAQPPPASLLLKLSVSSTLMLALGFAVFGKLKRRFFDYL